jgi:thioredoxin 1
LPADRSHQGSDWDQGAPSGSLGGMSLTTTSRVRATTDATFTADVLDADVPVLVDFTATWCPPCRVIGKVLDEVSADRDDLRIVALDIDAHPAAAAQFQVLAAPTLILFRSGQPILRLVGARPRRRLEQELDAALV